jgi:uncharacterized protein (TIGR02996 family)
MTDREALVRAVLAAPEDDAPRLVFADWCDENGDSEWAEFIRLQVERPQEPPTNREIDLFSECWREWVPTAL